jgi:hypothetical protein
MFFTELGIIIYNLGTIESKSYSAVGFVLGGRAMEGKDLSPQQQRGARAMDEIEISTRAVNRMSLGLWGYQKKH